MIEHMTWRRFLAAAGVTLLFGLSACGGSGDDNDAGDDSSPSDDASSEATATDETSTTAEPPKGDPSKKGGWKFLPACEELAESVVAGEDVEVGQSSEGRSCRFTIGTDGDAGAQVIWITRGGGDFPEKFKKDEVTELLADAGDDDRDWESKADEVDAPGWDYGVHFQQTLGKAERSSYRLFAFSKNGDLLNCMTTAELDKLDAFLAWCDDVKATVTP